LSVAEIVNGIIVPSHDGHFPGVFDGCGKPFDDMKEYYDDRYERDSGSILPIVERDEEVVFGGRIVEHFGHFMFESLGRLWAMLDPAYADKKIVFVSSNKWIVKPECIERTVSVVRMMGIAPDKIEILDNVHNSFRFRKIYVPEPAKAHGFGDSFNVRFKDIFDRVRENLPDTYKGVDKVFYSRDFTKSGTGSIIGEKKIVDVFRRNGFKVFYPDDMTMLEQMSLMKHCKVLAGFGGSSFHQSVFMPDGSGLLYLSRYTDLYTGSMAIQCNVMDYFKGMRSTYIEANANIGNLKCSEPCLAAPTRGLLQWLDDNGFKYRPAELGILRSEIGEYMCRFEAEKVRLDKDARRRYPRWLVRFFCLFVLKWKNRQHIMEKYGPNSA
jgi:hypothetical protein